MHAEILTSKARSAGHRKQTRILNAGSLIVSGIIALQQSGAALVDGFIARACDTGQYVAEVAAVTVGAHQ
jgi:hypothetical protein